MSKSEIMALWIATAIAFHEKALRARKRETRERCYEWVWCALFLRAEAEHR